MRKRIHRSLVSVGIDVKVLAALHAVALAQGRPLSFAIGNALAEYVQRKRPRARRHSEPTTRLETMPFPLSPKRMPEMAT
jgi:hypothetical protein